MNVKAQGLLNAAKWIEEQHGREGLRDVLQACSEAVRDRFITAIAINWHPLEEFVEFVTAADKLLGRGDGRLAEELGAAGAREAAKNVVLRIVFYVTKPEFFLRRAAGLWQQYNDEGEMEAPVIEPGRIVLRLSGTQGLPRIMGHVLAGWVRELARASGAVDAHVRIVEHVERGESAHCTWELRWTRDEPDAPPSSRRSRPPSKVPPR